MEQVGYHIWIQHRQVYKDYSGFFQGGNWCRLALFWNKEELLELINDSSYFRIKFNPFQRSTLYDAPKTTQNTVLSCGKKSGN